MKPIKFKEATTELKKPSNMTDEECAVLPIFRDLKNNTCISLWKLTIWERIKLLFHGRIWLGVMSGDSQPPVWLNSRRVMFKKLKKTCPGCKGEGTINIPCDLGDYPIPCVQCNGLGKVE